MKKIGKADILVVIILAADALLTAAFYPGLPDTIPIHFNIRGQADGFGGKIFLWLLFGILALLDLMIPLIRLIDPKKKNFERFGKAWDAFRVVLNLFWLCLTAATIGAVLGKKVNMVSRVMIPVGIMFAVLGNYMPKIRHNYTFGIRTPWTLRNEDVWNKTHRMAGPLWFISGAAITVMGFVPSFCRSAAGFRVFLSATLVCALVPMAYSYIIFKKAEKSAGRER